MLAHIAGFARADLAVLEALARAIEPPPNLSVSEWADTHRIVPPESGSSRPGKWDTGFVPFGREIMDCLHPDHPAQEVAFVGSAQVIKSEVGLNATGFWIDRAPGPIMTLLPSIDEARKYNSIKLDPMFRATAPLKHRVMEELSRDEKGSTAFQKRFAGGYQIIGSASSSKPLQMVSIKYLVGEELTEWPREVGSRGDPLAQAITRQKTYGEAAKRYLPSTPGIAGECRITERYMLGDRRICYLPFPCCGTFQPLTYPRMQPPSELTRNRATFACMACGEMVDQASMGGASGMLARHRWVPTWQRDGEDPVPLTIDAADIDRYAVPPCSGRVRGRDPSYRLWAAYSPFESWTRIWHAGVESKGDAAKEKDFVQQTLGEAYEMKAQASHEALLEAREDYAPRRLPLRAVLMTGAADVQKNRIEWAVWAWGLHSEGWLVDRGVIEGDPEQDAIWDKLDAVTRQAYPGASGLPVPVSAWGVDSGYLSPKVYGFTTRTAGRVFATDGNPRPDGLPVGTPRRVKAKDQFGRLLAQATLYPIGQFGLKSTVYAGFEAVCRGPDEKGRFPPGALHLARDLVDEAYARQLTAEVLIDPKAVATGNARRALMEKPGDRRQWMRRPGQPNEALDIAVICRALAWYRRVDEMTETTFNRLVSERHGVAPAQFDLFAPNAIDNVPAAPAGPPPVRETIFDRLARLNART
jgi:phage terminase large subunit GpA-like protein